MSALYTFLRQQEKILLMNEHAFECIISSRSRLETDVQAMRRMVHAALKDRANQRFILLSESCIPLYSPLVIYQQLMHEKRSRISACASPGWERSLERSTNTPPPHTPPPPLPPQSIPHPLDASIPPKSKTVRLQGFQTFVRFCNIPSVQEVLS